MPTQAHTPTQPQTKPARLPHYVLNTSDLTYPTLKRYARRDSAVRAACGLHCAYVLSNDGDHWGLWAGYQAGRELTVPELERRISGIEFVLGEMVP